MKASLRPEGQNSQWATGHVNPASAERRQLLTHVSSVFVSRDRNVQGVGSEDGEEGGSVILPRLGVPEPCPFPFAYPFPVHAHLRWVIQPDLPLFDGAHGDIAKVYHLLEAFLILVLYLLVLYAHQQMCTFSWGRERGMSWGEPVRASIAPAEQSLQDRVSYVPAPASTTGRDSL